MAKIKEISRFIARIMLSALTGQGLMFMLNWTNSGYTAMWSIFYGMLLTAIIMSILESKLVDDEGEE